MIETYTLVYLTIERTIAVCAPLFSKRYMTERLSVVLPAIGIGAILTVHTVFCLLLDDIIELPHGQNLCGTTNENIAAVCLHSSTSFNLATGQC